MATQYLSESLLQSRPFRYLSLEQIAYVQTFGRILEYRNNRVILTQGKVGRGIFIVLQGRADVAIRVLGEERLTLAHLEVGEFFGELNLINAHQSTASVNAQKKTICFLVPTICFDAFAISAPDIRNLISKALVEDVIQRYRNIHANVSTIFRTLSMTKVSVRKKVIHSSAPSLEDLTDITVFKNFDDADIADLLQNSKRLLVEDCALLDREQSKDSCLLVLKGAVMANISVDDKRTHFAVHAPNTFICPISLLDKKGDIFSYNTCGKAELLEIPASYLHSVLKNNPRLWYKFYDLFASYFFDLQKNLNTMVARLTNENFF